MSESETSKKLTKAIRSADKLINDLVKDWRKIQETIKELKEQDEEKED